MENPVQGIRIDLFNQFCEKLKEARFLELMLEQAQILEDQSRSDDDRFDAECALSVMLDATLDVAGEELGLSYYEGTLPANVFG